MGKKIRVNITIDEELLNKAKKKLDLFGGKLSTLFNLYLQEFVESMNSEIKDSRKLEEEKLKVLESRILKLEKKVL